MLMLERCLPYQLFLVKLSFTHTIGRDILPWQILTVIVVLEASQLNGRKNQGRDFEFVLLFSSFMRFGSPKLFAPPWQVRSAIPQVIAATNPSLRLPRCLEGMEATEQERGGFSCLSCMAFRSFVGLFLCRYVCIFRSSFSSSIYRTAYTWLLGVIPLTLLPSHVPVFRKVAL